jgi:molybdenum cofactor cytidylyltransferase
MGRPKALLDWHGETFLARLDRLVAAHCSETWIVTGAHDRELREAAPGLAARMTYNPRHEAGQFASLRHGLAQCTGPVVLLLPVDFGGVQASTVEAMASMTARAGDFAVVKPVYRGASGHPVLLTSVAVAALCAAPAESNGKAVLAELPSLKIEVDDPACVLDADTPEDYERLLLLGAAA